MFYKLILLTGLWLAAVIPIQAVENKGISITPSFAEITINSEKQKDIELILKNNSNTEEVFDLSVIDFGSLDETGGVAFLTTNADSAERKYSLASWISLEKSEVIVAPLKSQTVKVTILNKESLSPGGHYGAVLATIKNNDVRHADSVGINQTMASLLYVLKTGGDVKKYLVKEIEGNFNLFKIPKKIQIKIANEGNVHIIPRGDFEIIDGKNIIAKGILNENSSIVLPESIRKFDINIGKIPRWIWPGKYQTVLNVREANESAFTTKRLYFWYMGFEGVILVLILTSLLTILALRIGKRR